MVKFEIRVESDRWERFDGENLFAHVARLRSGQLAGSALRQRGRYLGHSDGTGNRHLPRVAQLVLRLPVCCNFVL
jgi:hypothetical protein